MRRALTVILAAALGLFTGCLGQLSKAPKLEGRVASLPAAGSFRPAARVPGESMPNLSAFVASAGATASSMQPMERKVIRNAELTFELGTPEEGKRRIEAIAVSANGFVVASEITTGDGGKAASAVTVIVRVPAAKFAPVLEEIRRMGYKVRREKITGQDVTEELSSVESLEMKSLSKRHSGESPGVDPKTQTWIIGTGLEKENRRPRE